MITQCIIAVWLVCYDSKNGLRDIIHSIKREDTREEFTCHLVAREESDIAEKLSGHTCRLIDAQIFIKEVPRETTS